MSDTTSIQSSSSGNSTTAFNLLLSERTVLGGASLYGQVQLDLGAARRDGIHTIVVRLKGSVYTLLNSIDGRSLPSQSSSDFLNVNLPLWNSGTSEIPAQTTIALPFSFTVPHNAPPTFSGGTQGRSATVSYAVEAIGERKGLFKSKRRIKVPLTIVAAAPGATPVDLKQNLTSGWTTGPWVTHEAQKKSRHGNVAHTKLELNLPDLQSFPTSTPIPYTLRITSTSKPLPGRSPSESVPPLGLLPTHAPSDVVLRLERSLGIKVSGIRDAIVDATQDVGGLGEDASRARAGYTVSTTWVPASSGGSWEMVETLSGRMVFQGTPSFSIDQLSSTHSLYVRVGADIKAHFPVTLDSGVGGFADTPPAWSPPTNEMFPGATKPQSTSNRPVRVVGTG